MSNDVAFILGLFTGIFLGGIVTAFIICSLINNKNVEGEDYENK